MDKLTASGAADIERDKEGLGTVGNILANAYVAGVQMAADKGLGLLTGTGAMLPMMVRSFGGGVQEARNKGYSHEQQLALGLTNAATEYFSEKLFGGNPVYDTDVGLVNRAINAAVKKFGGTDAAARVMSVLSSTAMETLNEGWEEVVSDLLNPMWEQIATGNRSEASLRELAEDWLVGVILGGAGQAGAAVRSSVTGEQGPRYLKTAEEIAAEPPAARASASDTSADKAQAGNLTPAANGAAEARKTASDEAVRLPRMSMADFANTESPVWNNVDYGDTDTQQQLMHSKHQEMVDAGEVVTVPEAALNEVAQAYPDLRGMKKSERTPILKQKINELKTSLRNMLVGLKGAYEFEVNGNILEARLYDTGVREVMQNITQPKAAMLTQSGDIFRNAQYLYSTPDYEGNPNIYRWNYFYSPVQIGNQIMGVRIAVRDMVPSADGRMDSQIYHWGIKEDAPLGGGRPGTNPNATGVSSDASTVGALGGGSRGPKVASPDASSATTVDKNIISQPSNVVNTSDEVRNLPAPKATEKKDKPRRLQTIEAEETNYAAAERAAIMGEGLPEIEKALPLPAPEVEDSQDKPRYLKTAEEIAAEPPAAGAGASDAGAAEKAEAAMPLQKAEETLREMLPKGSVTETPMDEYAARTAGYPVIGGIQIVPYKTYVQANDRGNYGLVVGKVHAANGEPRLWVDFWNKEEETRATVALPVSILTPVKGRYSMTAEESAAYDEALERVRPEELDKLPSEEEMREMQGWYSEKKGPFSPVDTETMPRKAQDYLQRAPAPSPPQRIVSRRRCSARRSRRDTWTCDTPSTRAAPSCVRPL